MGKIKYKFNPESLSYYKIESSFRQKALKVLAYFFVFAVNATIGYFIYSATFDSPKEKGLKRQISEMNLNIELFNKELDKIEAVMGDIQQRDDNIYRTIFEAEPLNYTVREAGFGGSFRYKDLENLDNAKMVVNTAKRLDVIKSKLVIQSKSYDELMKMAISKEKMNACTPSIQPIANKNLERTASGWGYRIHPIYKIKKFHYGIDFTAPTNTEIYATGDGTIEKVESSHRGYGNSIIVNHGYGLKTLYAHLDHFNVKQGQKVKRGQVIGMVGNTGLSTAPHLHYEVIHKGEKVNPVNYFFNDLTADEFDRMIELSMRPGQSFD